MTYWRQPHPREYVNRYFPPGSILAEPASTPHERSSFVQTAIDCLTLLMAFIFLAVTGLGIAFSIFVLLFVGV